MNRKYQAHLSLIALLTFGGPLYAQPALPDPFKSVQAKLQEKKYAEAVAEAESALANTQLSATDKVRFLKLAAEAASRLGKSHIPDAIAFHEQIVTDSAIPNRAKVEALNDISNLYIASLAGQELGRMDLAKAHAILDRGVALPELKPEEQALALKNIGRLYERQDQFAKARETYQAILALNAGDRVSAEAQRLIAGTYAGEGKVDEAVAIHRQFGWELVALYQSLGDSQKRDAEIAKQLADPSVPENVRWNNFNRFPIWEVRGAKLEDIQKAWDTYMPAFLEKDPNRALILQRKVVNKDTTPDFIAWAAPLVLAAPKIAPNDFVAVKSAYIEALAAEGNTNGAAQEAASLAGDERAPASTKLWAQLVAATIKPGAAANVTPLLGGAGVPNKEKSEAITRAARTALKANNEKSARGLFNAYESLLAKPARAAITCEFVERAPYDVGSWLASPLIKTGNKAKLDRPYGDNLKFLLETDSAMTGRNTTADAGQTAGDTETDLQVVCDAEGVHFYLNAADSRVLEVVGGLTGGGSFEMYLAPGANQAYYTFLADLPKGNIDPASFVTMYPNAQFRLPSAKEGSLRTETRPTDKGFAMHISLSWDVFYDKLPANGSKWQFEAIRWTRAGGFSFGGSESVHNRSSFGDVVFAGLTPERLNAIKRGIVLKAVAKYKQAKKLTGTVGNWPDPVLGDPAFYQTKLEPMVKNMDAYAEKVTKDMTAADVDLLFREAVPFWMDAEYQIAALRWEYLQEKLLMASTK